MGITLFEFVSVALVIRHSMRMLHTVDCGLPGYTIFFHIVSETARFLTKKNMKCELWFSLQLLSEKVLILIRDEPDMIKTVHCLLRTVPLLLSDFNETWIFSTVFRKLLKNQVSKKSFQWKPSCSMRTDGQTWRIQQSLFAILQTRLKMPLPTNTLSVLSTYISATNNKSYSEVDSLL
jgi:hypothetical protein